MHSAAAGIRVGPFRSQHNGTMSTVKRVCFFSHESRAQLQKEQYSIQDIRILGELGCQLTIATRFGEIPWGCDLYFSWWASGSILALIKARLSAKPIVVVAGGNDSMFYRDSVSGRPGGYLATPWYKKVAARVSLRYATVVLVVSRYMVDHVRRLGARSPIVVHNSVDTSAFRPSGDPRSFVTTMFDLEDGVVAVKRGEVFIRSVPLVLRDHPDQTFVVIGRKGSAFQRLRGLVSDLGIENNIEFVGRVDNSAVVSWLQRSRVYVQISDTETFGVAIAEAMSCGVPVVVSRMGAIPEIVGSCGVYVDHNDPRSVAAGIAGLLGQREEARDQLGVEARARIVGQFSYDQRLAAIREVIQALA